MTETYTAHSSDDMPPTWPSSVEAETSAVPEETKKEDPPMKVGSIQLNNGKADIMTEDGLVPYDIVFIVKQLRKAVKGPCRGHFADKFRYNGFCADLERHGAEAIDSILSRIKKLAIARDTNRNLLLFAMEHLERLKMIGRMNFAPPSDAPAETPIEPIAETFPASEEEMVYPEDAEGCVKHWKTLRHFRPLTISELEAEARDYERYIKEKK